MLDETWRACKSGTTRSPAIVRPAQQSTAQQDWTISQGTPQDISAHTKELGTRTRSRETQPVHRITRATSALSSVYKRARLCQQKGQDQQHSPPPRHVIPRVRVNLITSRQCRSSRASGGPLSPPENARVWHAAQPMSDMSAAGTLPCRLSRYPAPFSLLVKIFFFFLVSFFRFRFHFLLFFPSTCSNFPYLSIRICAFSAWSSRILARENKKNWSGTRGINKVGGLGAVRLRWIVLPKNRTETYPIKANQMAVGQKEEEDPWRGFFWYSHRRFW